MSKLQLFINRKWWKIICLILLANLFAASTFAQAVVLRGRVTDQKGQPLIGANVSVANASGTGTTTDISGNFTLSVTGNVTELSLSYIGYLTLKVPVKPGTTNLGVIILASDPKNLTEVIVVGYGSQSKRDITGATTTVSAKILAETPTPNFVDALKGRVAGLDIVTTSSRPGSAPAIHLRGNRTIGQNANSSADQPLLVVDGIPYTGSIADINPDNIKNIEILKDASSTAIYGSRGSGGVLLITTNRGSAGRSVTSFTSSVGIRRVESELPLFNAPQYAQLKADAILGSTIQGNGASGSYNLSLLEQQGKANGVDVDWQKYAYQTGINNDQHLNISGGSESTTFNVGAGYNAITDLIPNNRYDRYSLQIAVDHKLSKTIRVGANITNTLSYRKQPGGFPAGAATGISPLVSPFDDQGNLRLFPLVGAFDATTVTPLYYKYHPESSIKS